MSVEDELTANAVGCVASWFMILPATLVVWWLHRYVPFIPDMDFGPCLALVVVVHVLRRWS